MSVISRDASRGAARVRLLVEALQALLASETSRKTLISEIQQSTQLCEALVRTGLGSVLEHSPSDGELEKLVAAARPAERVWVTLSANVFTASFRAAALAVAASANVNIKPSTRENVLIRHLASRAGSLFRLCSAINPKAGDHVHAYGSDETMRKIRASLPKHVEFFGHGSGLGVCVIDAEVFARADADALAIDTVLFEQQGCLSPRLAYAVCDSAVAVKRVVDLLGDAFSRVSERFPVSLLVDNYQAERLWFERTAIYCGRVVRRGGFLVLQSGFGASHMVPPPLRCLNVIAVPRAPLGFSELEKMVTSVAVMPSVQALVRVPAGARICQLGEMQRPPFDGPVDLRKLSWEA